MAETQTVVPVVESPKENQLVKPKYENLIVHAYDWNSDTIDIETDKTCIIAHCLDQNSTAHILRFNDFPLFCHVELPGFVNSRRIQWGPGLVGHVHDTLKKILGEKAPIRAAFKTAQKIYYYRGQRETPFMLLVFRNLGDVFHCENVLNKPITISDIGQCCFRVYETQISIVRKMLTLRSCAYSQWFKCTGIKVLDEDKISTLDTEYIVSWKHLQAIPPSESKGWVTYPRILSFDIECYSDNHRALPNQYAAKCVVNMISCIFQRYKQLETRRRICLVLGECNTISYADICKSFYETISGVLLELKHLPSKDLQDKFEDSAFGREIKSLVKQLCPGGILSPDLKSNLFNFAQGSTVCPFTDNVTFSEFLISSGLNASSSSLLAALNSRDPEIRPCSTEQELCLEFGNLIQELDPEIITGYNILSFDYPYLDARLKRRLQDWPSVGRIIGKKTELKSKVWQSSAYGHQDLNILEADGRLSVDMLPIVKRDFKLIKYDLGTVSTHFLGRTKHDVKPAAMFKIFEDSVLNPNPTPEDKDNLTRFVRYCIEDAELCLDLFEKINTWVGLIEMSNIVGVTIMDLFTRGQQIRCMSQIYDLASKLGFVIDKRITAAESFTGAYVHEPLPGLYDDVSCIDFKSLYPSIIMAYNICYTTLVPPEFDSHIPDDQCHILEWDEESDGVTMTTDAEASETIFGGVTEVEGVDLVTPTETHQEDEIGTTPSNPTNPPKPQSNLKHYRFKFVKAPRGILPQLVDKLVSERRAVNAALKGETDPVVCTVLDKRQWALKISANSIFGFLGAQRGMLPLPEGAKSITATGRRLINTCNDYLVQKHNALIVYNDSVTPDTPILIRRNGKIEWVTIDSLIEVKPDSTDKTRHIPETPTEVWSDQGWTQIKQVIAHKTNKKIYRVATSTGVIDVTEDHSLLRPNGQEVSPRDIDVGVELLHVNLPTQVSDTLEQELVFENKLECAKIFVQFQGSCYIVTNTDSKYILKPATNPTVMRSNKCTLLSQLPREETFVYDLETENHHFSAGIGRLVVHNTDSSLFKLPNITSHQQALEEGEKVKDEINTLFPKPLEVELEKTGLMLSIRKKKYAFWPIDSKTYEYKLTKDGKPDIMMKGIVLARRDNCPWQRKVYNKVLLNIMFRKPMMSTYDYIISQASQLLRGQVDYRSLIIIRELGSHYKSASYFMKIFSDELRRAGKPANPGDRLEHVIVKTNDPAKQLLGYKLRTPEWYLENAENEPIDHEYYLEKVLMNCVEQLFQVGYKDDLAEMAIKQRRLDRRAVFLTLFDEGHLNMIVDIANDFRQDAPQLSPDQVEEYVIEYLCRETKIRARVIKLRTMYLSRKNVVSARITAQPIKAFLKMYRLYLQEEKKTGLN